MARMVPTPMLPTESGAERKLYEGFRQQLPDGVVVYHGTKWVRMGKRAREGESDFVIADPRRGVLCIEVKGGGLKFEAASRRWRQSDRTSSRLLKKDPFTQAQETMHWLMERMQPIPGWSRWRPTFGFAVAFPDADYREDAHPNAPTELSLDRRHLSTLASRIAGIMDRWGTTSNEFPDDGMRAIDEALGYSIELPTLGALVDDAERRMIRLTEEQSYIRDLIRCRPRWAIKGAAGSGKTLIALQTASWLAENGHRTLLTCINKRLGRYLAEATTSNENITATHFHSLAHQLAREAEVIGDDDQTQYSDPYFSEEFLPQALLEAASRLPSRFDAIVVDEAQDFRDPYWRALLAHHSSPAGTPLYVFADDNQNIYKGSSLPVEPGEIFGPLRKNMRNSREIQEFLAALHDGEGKPLIDGPEIGPVEVGSYKDSDDLAAKVDEAVNEILRQGIDLEHIVLLTPFTIEKSQIRGRERIGKFTLSEEEQNGALLTATLHSFKGLEKQVVILAELGERGDKHLVEFLYVGGSRARHRLILFAVPEVAAKLAQLPGTRLRE